MFYVIGSQVYLHFEAMFGEGVLKMLISRSYP